jgi:hypothetical protein
MKAFPTEIASPPGYRRANYDEGMDLRDYFASDAMKGMLAHSGAVYGKNADSDDAAGATRAYKIADAMMKARDETR